MFVFNTDRGGITNKNKLGYLFFLFTFTHSRMVLGTVVYFYVKKILAGSLIT